MCREATWFNEPLTEEERAFAEENFYVMFRFMSSYKLDQSEWYDILVLPYLRAVRKYCSRRELNEQYSFSTIAYKVMSLARHHYWRSYYVPSRMPEGGFVNLDYTMQGDNPFAENKLDVFWIDHRQQVEELILDKETLTLIFRNLDGLQTQIFSALLEGYTQSTIRELLNISYNRFKEQLEYIKDVTYTVLYRD